MLLSSLMKGDLLMRPPDDNGDINELVRSMSLHQEGNETLMTVDEYLSPQFMNQPSEVTSGKVKAQYITRSW